MNKYTHGRTCVYNINYHIVWCVKYRRKVLSQKISERLYELCHEIAKAKGFTVVEGKVGENDHVHCFVSAPPKISITQIVKYLKGISGNRLLEEFPELRKSGVHVLCISSLAFLLFLRIFFTHIGFGENPVIKWMNLLSHSILLRLHI